MKNIIGYVFSRKDKKIICSLSAHENEKRLKQKTITYLTNLGLKNLEERSEESAIKRDVAEQEQATKRPCRTTASR